MKVASVADLGAHVNRYVKASASPVVITRKGKAVAILLALEGDEDDLERLMLSCSPKFRAIVSAAKERFARGEGIPEKDFWKMVSQKYPKRHA